MTTLQSLRARKPQIQQVANQYGVHNIRVFGSVARGEDTANSDIDLLVDMEETRSLLDLVGFQQSVQAILKQPTDILTENSISPYLRESILREAISL